MRRRGTPPLARRLGAPASSSPKSCLASGWVRATWRTPRTAPWFPPHHTPEQTLRMHLHCSKEIHRWVRKSFSPRCSSWRSMYTPERWVRPSRQRFQRQGTEAVAARWGSIVGTTCLLACVLECVLQNISTQSISSYGFYCWHHKFPRRCPGMWA